MDTHIPLYARVKRRADELFPPYPRVTVPGRRLLGDSAAYKWLMAPPGVIVDCKHRTLRREAWDSPEGTHQIYDFASRKDEHGFPSAVVTIREGTRRELRETFTEWLATIDIRQLLKREESGEIIHGRFTTAVSLSYVHYYDWLISTHQMQGYGTELFKKALEQRGIPHKKKAWNTGKPARTERDPKVLRAILEAIKGGSGLMDACEKAGLSMPAFYAWEHADPLLDLFEQIADARMVEQRGIMAGKGASDGEG